MIQRSRLVAAVTVPAAVVLSLVLSACAPKAGAAATVGDRRISVAQVQSAFSDIEPLVGQDQQITQADILNLLILRPYLVSAASRVGNGVSLDTAQNDIKTAGANSTLGTAAVEVWQANLAFSAVQQNRTQAQVNATFSQIGQDLKKAGVSINPRYGAGINYATFAIEAEQPNWFPAVKAPSSVAPSAAAPTPAPTAP